MSSPVQVLAHDRRIAEALLEISYAVGSVMEIDDIMQRICDIGARVMETDTCSVYLIDKEDPNFLVLHASRGLSRAQELGVRGFKVGEGIPGWAAGANKTVTIRDARNDPRDAQLDDTPEEMKFIAFLCTPLRIQDEVVGVLSLRRGVPTDWRDEELVFAEIVAKQIAIVLEKARLYHEKVEAERLAAIAISLSEVAHYIKNVLQNMMGGAYFIETGLDKNDAEKARKGWVLLRRSVDKIQKLVENMLVYSRQNRCELRQHDLNSLIAQMAGEMEDSAHQRGVRLDVSLDPRVPVLMLDPEAIYDAVLNLTGNAIDAIPEDREGLVAIATVYDEQARRVRVTVRDNGTGIPEDVQKRIFNLFFSTKGRGGTGIGLAVTRKIIDEHHGRLAYETKDGVGTTFTIELPVPG